MLQANTCSRTRHPWWSASERYIATRFAPVLHCVGLLLSMVQILVRRLASTHLMLLC
jgi:hypothetical protein